MLLFQVGFLAAVAPVALSGEPSGVPFDMAAIRNDPLAAETVSIERKDGIVIEHVAFNGDRDRDGKFIRCRT